MDPITIASLASSVIPSIAKLFGGNSQIKKAEQLERNNVFTPYQIPQEALMANQLAENEFLNGMPGLSAAEAAINNNGAATFERGVQGASSSGDVLDLATKVGLQGDSALNNLNGQALAYRQNALGNYRGSLLNLSGFRDKAYQINKLDPYLRTANLAASLYGAGQQNKFSALDGLATSAIGGLNTLSGKPTTPQQANGAFNPNYIDYTQNPYGTDFGSYS